MRTLFTSLMLTMMTGSAFAAACIPGQDCPIPEPGSLALVGIAAAAGLFVALRKKK